MGLLEGLCDKITEPKDKIEHLKMYKATLERVGLFEEAHKVTPRILQLEPDNLDLRLKTIEGMLR
jgi:hypothetical protein